MYIKVFLIECIRPSPVLTGGAVFRTLITFRLFQTNKEVSFKYYDKKVYIFYVPESIHLFYPMIFWPVLTCINLCQLAISHL